MINRGKSRSKTRPPKAKTPTHAPAPGHRRPFTGFDRERAAYHRLKPELLAASEGKFVVLIGDEVIGPFDTHEEAEQAGYERFGLGPLYIKQILAEEPIVQISRFGSA
jgi:hypothetical protein